MAIITKIRNQSTLLIVLIGASMALFVIGDQFVADLFTGGGRPQDQVVGTIDGDDVDRQAFELAVEHYIQKSFPTGSPSQEQREQIRRYIWGNMVQDRVLFSEAYEAGLSLSEDEVTSLMGGGEVSEVLLTQLGIRNQQRQLVPQFANPDGTVNNQAVLRYVGQLSQDPQRQDYLVNVKNDVKRDRLRTKYFNLVEQGVYVTAAEAKARYHAQQDKIAFKYVGKKLSEVSDSLVSVSDADLEAYYNAHKNEGRYAQKKESRDIQYLLWDVIPTAQDSADMLERLKEVATGFVTCRDDQLYASQKTDTDKRFNTSRLVGTGDLPGIIDSLVQNTDSSAVYGPYEDKGYYNVVKVVGSEKDYDSVAVRHILIKTESMSPVAADTLLDSLKTLVENGASFADLAEEFTEDPGSKDKGGFYDYFGKGRMVPEFEKMSWELEVGEMGVANTSYGKHLILVEGKKGETDKKRVAIIEKKIEPSQDTDDSVWELANTFSMENNTSDSYQEAGNAKGLRVAEGVIEGQKSIQFLGAADDLVRWAFEAQLGEVSEPFQLENNRYAVCHITNITPAGVKPLEAVRDLVEIEAKKQAKREYLAGQLSGVSSLEDAATKLGKTVSSVSDLRFDGIAPEVGGEKELIGALAGAPTGTVFGPVKSTNGVYMFIKESVQAAEGEVPGTIAIQTATRLSSSAQIGVYRALEEKAGVEDHISKYY